MYIKNIIDSSQLILKFVSDKILIKILTYVIYYNKYIQNIYKLELITKFLFF